MRPPRGRFSCGREVCRVRCFRKVAVWVSSQLTPSEWIYHRTIAHGVDVCFASIPFKAGFPNRTLNADVSSFAHLCAPKIETRPGLYLRLFTFFAFWSTLFAGEFSRLQCVQSHTETPWGAKRVGLGAGLLLNKLWVCEPKLWIEVFVQCTHLAPSCTVRCCKSIATIELYSCESCFWCQKGQFLCLCLSLWHCRWIDTERSRHAQRIKDHLCFWFLGLFCPP